MSDAAVHWRCFHCGDAFGKSEVAAASEHFGANQFAEPVCLMRVPGERGLLTALRNAEAQLERYRAEDSDVLRAMASMATDHAEALRREEEAGYAKGLRDGRAHQDAVESLAMLRALVDLAWQAATESEQVPSTDLADRLIERAIVGAPKE